ncbi:MAG: ABC transporter permease subunit [Acidimicrobiia bacterium]
MLGFDLSLPFVLLGGLTGLSYGLLAVGVVLVYRSSKFINFAYAGTGILAAAIAAIGINRFDVPYVVGFIGALAIGAGVSAGVDIFIVRKLANTPKVLPMVATLGVGEALILTTLALNDASGKEYPQPPFFPEFDIGALYVSPASTALAILTPIAIIGLTLFFKRSRFGIGVRAASINEDAAETSGISPKGMSTLSWGLAGAIAAFSALLVLPSQGTLTPDLLGPDLLLRGLAAAALAGFVNLPVAMATGVGIGVLEQVLRTRPGTAGYIDIALFAIILIGIGIQTYRAGPRDSVERWQGVSLPRRLPEAYRGVWLIRNLGRIFALFSVGVAMLIPVFATNRFSFIAITVMCFSIVGLSVGLLTGFGGQVSLGQFAYGGVAAAVSVIVVKASGVFFAGIVAGAIVAAILAVLVGFPALRVQGLLLAVATLGFALVVSSWLLRQEWMFGRGIAPPQPIFGSIIIDTARSYYYVVLLGLVIMIWVTRNLRRSGFGRKLVAVRDNEPAARALTVPASRTKLQLYGVTGAIAGVGGALFGHAHTQLSSAIFPVQASIDVVIATVIGGLEALTGPLVGALYLVGIPRIFEVGVEGLAAMAAVWLVIIINQPRGFLGILTNPRDRMYDTIAKFRGIDPATARSVEGTDEIAAASQDFHVAFGSNSSGEVLAQAITTPHALEVTGLTKRFGGLTAVNDVSLTVDPGDTLGLIGPNGAGKTTLFEMVGGFLKPDTGTVVYEGVDITSLSPEKRARKGLVRSFQNAEMFPTMTLLEAVMVAKERTLPSNIGLSAIGYTRRDKRREQEALELIDLFGLTRYRDVPLGAFSTGTRRIAEFACDLALEPKVLLLDEPSAGIAQAETEALAQALERIRDTFGITIVVIEHDMPLLLQLCNRMIALEAGEVIAEGSPQAVQNDPRVVESYLGIRA